MKKNLYYRHRFPAAIICHCVWQALESLAVLNERRHAPACNSFSLSLRDIEKMMLYRGIEVTYESIRDCVNSRVPLRLSAS